MTGAKPKKESADNGLKILIKENALLKSKIAYSLGSLETLSYLLKNDDPETLQRNLEHMRNTVNRVLGGLKEGL
jgi:hypothetical protein